MKIKVTLILLFVFIFIRLIKILNLFFTIKIGRIYTSRVGHIAKNLENYIHETRNEKGLITFFGTDKKIANNFLLKLFKRKNIFFGRFFFFVYMQIKDRKDYFDLLVSENKLNPNFSLVAKEKLNIKIPKKVDDFGSKFLNDNKIMKNFVVFHNRDASYNIGDDKNFHEYRNFDFKDYYKTIEYCNNQNISTVRIGNDIQIKDNLKNKNHFLLDNNKISEELSIYMLANCKFMISCNCGFLDIGRSFRKPSLMINTVPFDIQDFDTRGYGSIIMPKKIYNKNKKKMLTLKDISDLVIDIHYKGNFFSENNLEWIDNSQDEILMSFKEMIKKIDNDSEFLNEEDKEIRDRLFDIFKENKFYKIMLNELNINISYSFLKQNRSLLN